MAEATAQSKALRLVRNDASAALWEELRQEFDLLRGEHRADEPWDEADHRAFRVFAARQLDSEDFDNRLHDAVMRDAVRQARADAEAALLWSPPPYRRTLTEDLDEPREPGVYTVEGLHRRGFNTTIAAQYKTGKTTLVSNLTKSLVDGVPFLDRWRVQAAGRVGFLNYEVDKHQFVEEMEWLNISNTDAVSVLNLRGYELRLADPWAQQFLIDWCRELEIRHLVIDTYARAYGDDEGDNRAIGDWGAAVDSVKRRAGVLDTFITVHTGRSDDAQERARGGTRLDDWVDARWVYMRGAEDEPKNVRYLMAHGRRVDVPKGRVLFNTETSELTWQGESPTDGPLDDRVDALAAVVRESDGIATTALRDACGFDKNVFTKVRNEAERRGLIRVERPETGNGAHRHYIAAPPSAAPEEGGD